MSVATKSIRYMFKSGIDRIQRSTNNNTPQNILQNKNVKENFKILFYKASIILIPIPDKHE